jgi:hypothetical protein
MLFASASTTAQTRDPDLALKRIQTVLGVLNQELTATYEQIKTLRAARAANDCSSLNVQGRPPALTTEDEVAAAKSKAIAREQEIQTQMDAAFSHIKEIEAQKQPILQRLRSYLDAEHATEPSRTQTR